ncbi:MAG TPA: S41 family peptidase [Candidatus Saccharimonadales bacterium]|nr:S41 family peptidase [Candidatus Saccharimonadales bacterium]
MFRKKKHVEGTVQAPRKRRFNWKQTVVGVLVGVGIFYLGIAVGQGRISFGPDAVFHKSQNNQLPAHLSFSDVDTLYNSLRDNFDGQLDANKLLDGLKTGLANAAGDPYTEYLNTKDAQDFNDQLNGTFTGIGAELSKDTTNNTIVVISPIAGFPAEKAGLKPKDVIVEVDGKSTADITVSEAVKRIRGPKDTHVKLKVVRGGSQQLELDIVRQEITIPSVETKTLNGNIGYIKISRFAEDTSSLARDAAQKFKQAGVKGIIVDVRGDPGGLLDAAVNVSSLWLNNQTVLTERRGEEVVRTYPSEGTPVLNGIPTVVLIDEGSASASEITAGALHDNKAATLVGVKSFGKGSVQQLVKFNDGSVLKVTIAKWYTPGGININKNGINPDKEVKRSDDDIKNGKDPQLDAALQQLSK